MSAHLWNKRSPPGALGEAVRQLAELHASETALDDQRRAEEARRKDTPQARYWAQRDIELGIAAADAA